MTKLVGAMVIYNEETFVGEAIKNLLKISDVSAIEILDGAWVSGGRTVSSTDNSRNIIENLKKETHVPINFTDNHHFWESEPYKRNWRLQQIDQKYGPDTWVFWFDGDEEIRFHTGIHAMDMLPTLSGMKNCGIVTTYGYGFSIPYPGPRFIPLGRGIHFYSEMANHLHDGNCDTIMNWATGKQKKPCWFMDKFFIVNHWMYRNGTRLEDKIEYFKWQAEQAEKTKNYPKCHWAENFKSSLISKPTRNH